MPSLKIISPAKINLFLKVLSKRPDGFHEIQTLFQRISLKDEIRLQTIRDQQIVIECNEPWVPTDRRNIIYQAIQMLRDESGIKAGVKVSLQKNIPVAAGLAGGSKNAAATLLGMNQLWKLNFSRKKLLGFARRLGSDVPFFLYDTAWGWGKGRGDEIHPIHIDSVFHYVVVVPRVPLLAKDVYQGLKTKLTKNSQDVNILPYHLRKNDLKSIRSLIINDLEPVVLRLHPPLSKLKERLKCLKAKAVMVSGSGPAVFALMESRQDAREAVKLLSRTYRQVYAVQTY